MIRQMIVRQTLPANEDGHAGGIALRDVMSALSTILVKAGIVSPQKEARLLVQEIAGLAPAQVIGSADLIMDRASVDVLMKAARRRACGEPLYRIVGHRGFYGVELVLSRHTLEPRPDTETLVDAVLPHLLRMVSQKGDVRLLDLGTGTGAVALALLKECPQASAVATDISPAALEMAAENARRNGLQRRFSPLESNWFDKVEGQFDLVVSNPPYIASADIDDLADEVRLFDPIVALDGGPDGLMAYRALAAGARDHVLITGLMAVEIGFAQGAMVRDIFQGSGMIHSASHNDLTGHERVLVFRSRQTGCR